MHRSVVVAVVLLVTFFAVSLALAKPAGADRGEITDQTPYTLEPAEVRVGLSDVSVGLFGHDLLRRIEIGTRPIAWLPSLAGATSYDVRGKFELWRDEYLSLAVGAEHLHVDLSRFASEAADRDAHAEFSITPIEGWAGLRLGQRWRVNSGVVYTRVKGGGGTSVGSLDELGGAVGTSSAQIRANVDVQLIPAIHAVIGGRFTPWQQQWGEVKEEEGLDDNGVKDGSGSNTTRGEGDLMRVGGRAWSVGGELHFTWEHTNIRLGLEYGYYTVPIVNFVVPQKGFLPVVDLYWRI